jgi:hyperosmotically inducible periplasmic protein
MIRKNPLTVLALGVALALPLATSVSAQQSTKQTAEQYTDDSAITAKVKANIVQEQLLKGLEISVTTTQGAVQLSGTVSTNAQKSQATQIASNTAGVKSVQNNILVDPQMYQNQMGKNPTSGASGTAPSPNNPNGKGPGGSQ